MRSARLYDADDLLGDYLLVFVDVSLQAFSVSSNFQRWVSESISGESWYAATFNSGYFGTHGSDPDYILQLVGESADNFVLEYLRANEEACE